MKHNRVSLLAILCVAALTLIIAGVAGAIVGNKSLGRRQEPVRRQVTSLPPVSSKIPSIEVLKAYLKREGTPAASAAVEVRNNSERGITSITLTCGEGGVETNGLSDPDNPQAVIPAHGTKILEMGLGAMMPDCSLQVSAVTYSDGVEEGLPDTLNSVHGIRAHDKAEREANNGGKH